MIPVSESDGTRVLNTLTDIETHHDMVSIRKCVSTYDDGGDRDIP